MKDDRRKRKRIRFFTLGCKANQYDTQSIRERFLSKGFRESENNPDYFLINTCTVTSSADQKSRNIIRRCFQSNPRAKVIVTGCLAENDYQQLQRIEGISLILKKGFFPEGISRFSGRTRAFLKIQDGCNNFCTYCKVALVRGKPRSKSLQKIIEEAKGLVSCGYREIVLTGICLGAFGKDLNPKRDLVDVIELLEKIDGLLRIRLSSIEAGDVSGPLIKCFKKSKKLCRHLHIPIQSGDNAILKRMNRKYTHEGYLRLIERLKKEIPGICITTDCLVGFPGETEKNFKNTVSLVKKIKPLKVHIFPYSVRKGTKAAGYGAEIGSDTINCRCKELETVSRSCRLAIVKNFLNKSLDVLIEGKNKDAGFWQGYSDNYIPVKLPFIPGLDNKIIVAIGRKFSDDAVIGELLTNFKLNEKIKT